VLVLYKETDDEKWSIWEEGYKGKIDLVLEQAPLRVNPSVD
jgi:hypothetical protein